MSAWNFSFLKPEWPELADSAARAESLAMGDARAACFYARRALELVVAWLFKYDSALRLPYQENLSALIHEPTFKATVGEAVFSKARVIPRLGNEAVHSARPVRQFDALTAVRELFHLGYWLARHYARGAKPGAALVRLREEIAAAKKQNAATPDTHDYSEAETRDYLIDLLLKEAGWALDQTRDREFPVTGMPNESGEGLVDYVLWGDDGLPLAINEAKRTKKSAALGQQQAKLYADCLEKQFGRRPVIFYSNGYEHRMWDDTGYPPREVQGFYKKAELELMIQRRESRRKLAEAEVDGAIVERYYQMRAIRKIGEAFEKDRERKALMVMAVNAFKKFLPDSPPVNLVTEKDKEGRILSPRIRR